MQKKLDENKQQLLIIVVVVAFMAVLAIGVGVSRSSRVTAQPTATPEAQFVSVAGEPMEAPAPSPAPVDIQPFELTGMAEMTDTQRNSINMLNYLMVMTHDINHYRSNRPYLEKTYANLLNNIPPDVVDYATQIRLNGMLDTLFDYRMLDIKRERMQFVYEQNQAQAMRNAVPDAGAVLNAVLSFDPARIVGSLVYMAVDSASSYASGMAAADMAFIQSGWELDDSADEYLHADYKQSNDYAIEITRDYDLDGKYVLNLQAVEEFNKWKNSTNTLQKIQFFEANASTYQFYGPYWLTLAECYYANGDYVNCLRAIATYEALDIQIFRLDHDFAAVLPLGIAAASQVMEGDQYVQVASHYAELILANTGNADWALRYFAAQTFADLYVRTQDGNYLRKAYDITLNNVNILVDKQRELNATYVADVQLATVPKDADKAEKAEISEYNTLLKEVRKTELPPMYEPLLLNCDLLLALAGEMELDEAERQRVDGILHENGEPLFLVAPVDARYYLSATAVQAPALNGNLITLNSKELTLPVHYVSNTAVITMTITCGDETVVFTDWQVKSVTRPAPTQSKSIASTSSSPISSFTVTYTSAELDKYTYQEGSTIIVEVLPREGCDTGTVTCTYTTHTVKDIGLFPRIELERVSE